MCVFRENEAGTTVHFACPCRMKSAVDEEKGSASAFKARLMKYVRPRSKLATPIVQIDDDLDEISEGSDRCGERTGCSRNVD